MPAEEPMSELQSVPLEGGAGAAAGEGILLSYYAAIVRRYLPHIVVGVLACTALVILVTLALPKQYEADTLIRVDPQSSSVVGDSSTHDSSPLDATLVVNTESRVITSPAVVLQAVRALKLDTNPEFRRNGGETLQGLLRNVEQHIGVFQPVGTMLLQISFRSQDPQLAARAANELAEAFLQHEYNTRARALTDSTQSMSSQISTLRAQMEQDEGNLVNYESKHDVIDPDDRQNIYQTRLGQINADLSQAQSQRMSLEADYQLAGSGDLDAILASPRGAVLLPLQQRLEGDQRALSQLATLYGPRHPLYSQQQALVSADQQALAEAKQHVASQVKAQYLAALQRERLIAGALQEQKQAMDGFNMRAIPYHSLKAASDSSTKLYYDLQQRIQDATVAAGLRSEDLRVISVALPPDRAVSPRPFLYGAVSAVIFSFLGLACALLVGVTDRTFSSAEQTEARLGQRVLASLPRFDAKGQAHHQLRFLADAGREGEAEPAAHRSIYQEAVLSLRSAIQFDLAAGTGTIMAVTSAVPGEGKSSTCSCLAAAFASQGVRTLLVDCDLRKPSMHRIFEVSNRIGLSTVLQGKCRPEEAMITVQRDLTLLPAGGATSRPSELLHAGLANLLENLRPDFGVLLVDCPPLLGLADSLVVANIADRVLLVLAAGQTDERLVRGAVRALRAARAETFGIVLNRVRSSASSYYGEYYQSYHAEQDSVAALDD